MSLLSLNRLAYLPVIIGLYACAYYPAASTDPHDECDSSLTIGQHTLDEWCEAYANRCNCSSKAFLTGFFKSLSDVNVSLAVLENWARYDGFSSLMNDEVFLNWLLSTFTKDKAAAWMDAGIDDPKEAYRWLNLGFSVSEAGLWRSFGFTPSSAFTESTMNALAHSDYRQYLLGQQFVPVGSEDVDNLICSRNNEVGRLVELSNISLKVKTMYYLDGGTEFSDNLALFDPRLATSNAILERKNGIIISNSNFWSKCPALILKTVTNDGL